MKEASAVVISSTAKCFFVIRLSEVTNSTRGAAETVGAPLAFGVTFRQE
jgi:hypothetical protein